MFTDKGYGSVKNFIYLLSNYLIKLEDFESSISFVLTKGLTKESLLQILKAFKASPMMKSCVLPPKEEAFLDFLEKSIKRLNDEFVI
jgi:hypothetical protein